MPARDDIINAINGIDAVDDSHMLDDAALVLVANCLATLGAYRQQVGHARVMREVTLYTNIGQYSLYDYVVSLGYGMCGMAVTGDLRRFRAALQQGGGCACVIL